MKYSEIFNLKGFSFIEIVFLVIVILCAGFLTLLGGGVGDSIKDGYSKAAATIQMNNGNAGANYKANEGSIQDGYSKAAAKIQGINQENSTEKAAENKSDSPSAEDKSKK